MKTKLYAKKTLSVFLAIMMLMSAWVFVAPEEASAASATDIAAANTNKVQELNGLNFETGFTTTSGNFQGDNATTMANKGYYKNTLYSPHFPASNNNLTNNDAGVYFGNLGNTADGARVWYPETTLIWDGSTTPQIPILFDIDSNNNNRVGVKNVYISSGANGLSFKDSYWTAKSECAKDTNYYTHFTFDWIMSNNSGNFWISTSSGNDKESMCSSKGYWDIYGTYLQYTGGSFGSGSTYYKAITPTWVCRTGSNYTGTTNKTIYVIDYVPLKNALSSVQGIINSINSAPAKYTTDSVSAFVEAAKKLVAAKPNNYINSGKNDVYGWNTAVSSALSAWNSAKNLAVQNYTLKFVDINGNVKHTQTSAYGTAVNCTNIAAGLGNTIKQHNDQYHQTYKWDLSNAPSSITDDVTILESPSGTVAHSFSTYTQGADEHSRTCSVCSYVQTQSHIKGTGYVTKAETCTEDGVMTYDCSTCGKKAIETSVINNITGHDFNEIVIKKSGVDGSHWRKCSRCDAYGWAGVENESQKHNWDKNADGNVDANDAISSKASTCEVAGYETYECTVCKDTYTKTLELAKHTIIATAAKDVKNICGGDGNAAFWTCSVCKRVWKDAGLTDELENTTDADNDGIPDELEVKGPDHAFTGAYVNVKNGADGTHYRQCERFTQCGKYGLMVDGVAVEGATEKHKFTSTETASTCTVQGTKTYTCSDCKHSYSEKLPLAAHKMTKHDKVEAKCGIKGSIEYYSCEVCNKKYSYADGTTEVTDAQTVIPALEHSFFGADDKQNIDTDPQVSVATCQKPAIYKAVCDYCGTVSPEKTYEYGDPDTDNGHKFNGEIRKDDNGTHSYKCTVAGCEEYGNAATCQFTVQVKDVASTCHTLGYTITKCATCGKENRVNKIDFDFTNHDGKTEVRSAVEAKCNADGYTGDTFCLGCNTKKKSGETIEANPNVHPHVNMKDYASQAPTCQADGWKAYKFCDQCGTYAIEKEILAKKSHTFTTYVSNGNGTHTAVCDTCPDGTEKATADGACSGGTANCVDEKVCTVCKTAYGDIDPANHKSVVVRTKVPSTCQKEGTEAYNFCEACNKATEEIKKIEKLPHVYNKWTSNGNGTHSKTCTLCDPKVATPDKQTADCNGGTAYCNELARCKDCNEEYGVLDPANHSTEANTLKDVVEATCQKEGFSGNYRYDCCNAIKEAGKVTDKLAHNFSIEVEGSRKAATCIAKGEVTYMCSTCVESDGEVATEKKELDINSKNHASDETVIKNQKAATCEEDGHTGDVYYKCCYVEGGTAEQNRKALKEKGTTIKANGQHIYGEAIPEYMAVITEAADGEKTLSAKAEPDYETKIKARREDNKWYHFSQCTICGVITEGACYTFEHTYDCDSTDTCEVCNGLCSLKDEDKHTNLKEIPEVPATQTTDGTKAYYKCEDCGKFFLDEAGKKEFDPTSEEGKKLITVSKETVACEHAYDKTPVETVEPSCGEDGYKVYKCTKCGKEKKEFIPATEGTHEWSEDYKTVKEPTCGANGYKALYCTKCDKMKPNSATVIPATGEHSFVLMNVEEGTSCTDPTIKSYECKDCGKTKTETDYSGAAAHEWGEWINKGGSCASGVTLERTCKNCTAKEQKKEESSDHSFEIIVKVEPTCEEAGYMIEKCKNCDLEKRTDLPVDPETEGHVFNEEKYKTLEKASCEAAEKREYVCVLCGEKVIRYVGAPLDHVWLLQPAEIATCTRPGHREYYRCVRCEKPYDDGKGEIKIEQLDHEDLDNNGKCDECNGKLYDGGESNCGCMCHKEGWLMKIIYKILNFFWKLFKTNHSCACGATHY